ncbi:MAG: hypothetical protein DLM63_07505 [Solirubrobacterales bacterium]|nr:MAG: hypothetical protein DLM63_07505 [Solirubrobacterales bacterium]
MRHRSDFLHSRLPRFLLIALGAILLAPATASAAAGTPPAGGAAIGQIIGATAAAIVLTAGLLALGIGHRSGRFRGLKWASELAGRLSGLPAWAALPVAIAAGSLVCAVFGLYWDISLHIDNGRDPGPLANPAHYFILAGLFGIFSAGWLAIVLPTSRPSPAAIRIVRGWEAPLGGVLMMVSSSFALLGFPLDDEWHRLFGQDVTLWGPTHLIMLSGAAMTLVGILVTLAEARLALRDQPVGAAVSSDAAASTDAAASGDAAASTPALRRADALVERVLGVVPRPLLGLLRQRSARLIAGCGGVLLGLSIYQGEFDFGVPQFRLLLEPVLLALAAAVALVTIRVIAGRGTALGAVAFYLIVRGVIALLVSPLLGQTTPHFPLYIAEALLVEGVALVVSTQRPYRFALAAGGLIGSVGVLAEWGWSHVWMPEPWPAHIVGEAIALSLPAALAGAVLGAFFGGALSLRPEVAATRRAWVAAATSLAVIGVVIAVLIPTTVPAGAHVQVTLSDTPGSTPAHREVQATARFVPAAVTRGADWIQETAWQGHAKLLHAALVRVGDGVYRTPTALPAFGTWKSVIRFHRGTQMASIPVYLPADAAIPAPGVPALTSFDRPLQADRLLLQRERKRNVAPWLWGTAVTTVLGLILALLVALGWGLARLARAGQPSRQRQTEPVSPGRSREVAGVA